MITYIGDKKHHLVSWSKYPIWLIGVRYKTVISLPGKLLCVSPYLFPKTKTTNANARISNEQILYAIREH